MAHPPPRAERSAFGAIAQRSSQVRGERRRGEALLRHGRSDLRQSVRRPRQRPRRQTRAAAFAGRGLSQRDARSAPLAGLAPLPETAAELEAVARTLNAQKEDINLREAATETRVKSAPAEGLPHPSFRHPRPRRGRPHGPRRTRARADAAFRAQPKPTMAF